MQRFCNSWHVRNLLAMVLRLNKSLKLAESIMSLYPHQVAQAQHQLSSISTVYTPLLACHQQCRRGPLLIGLNIHAERSSPQTAGHFNISNYTMLITFKLHTTRIWLFAMHPDALNPLGIMNSTLTKIRLKTWTVSLPRTGWNHFRVGVSTPGAFSADDGNTPRCRQYAELSHPSAMETQSSGLPWDESTKQSLLPICNPWRVEIYPVWDQEAGHEDVLWHCAEGRKHLSALRKLQKRGWHPEAHH